MACPLWASQIRRVLVLTPRDDARPVRTPSHAQDGFGMSGKRFSDGLSALRVPDPEGVVATPRDDSRPIGTPSHASHGTCMVGRIS